MPTDAELLVAADEILAIVEDERFNPHMRNVALMAEPLARHYKATRGEEQCAEPAGGVGNGHAKGSSMTGIELIAAERQRQVSAEGWTTEHDDTHEARELLLAAEAYLRTGRVVQTAMEWITITGPVWLARTMVCTDEQKEKELARLKSTSPLADYFGVDHLGRLNHPKDWPWSADDWKPTDDPIPNLVKAGALIAAEIDRLQRKALGTEVTQ